MINFPGWIERPSRVGAGACDAACFLMAVAPACDSLPPVPPRCTWLIDDGIAALGCEGTPGDESFWTNELWRVPGIARVDPQPVFRGAAAVRELLQRHALPLRRLLADREACAEYRVSVSAPDAIPDAGTPADARIFARLAQGMADLSQAVRATPPHLVRVAPGDRLIALSLMLHSDRIPLLLTALDEASRTADARQLNLTVVGPDALRSFPVSLAAGEAPLFNGPLT